MILTAGSCLWCGKRGEPLDAEGLCDMCREPPMTPTSRVGEMDRDILDCGDPETSLHETIRHFRWRAQAEAATARELRRTAADAKSSADEHSERAEGFLRLAAAMERLPVSFPASAIEAASAGETAQTGSTEGESAVGDSRDAQGQSDD